MKFRSLLGILAVVGAVLGAMSVLPTGAYNTSPNPAICAASITLAPGPVPVTPPYNCVDIQMSSPFNAGNQVFQGSPLTVTDTLTAYMVPGPTAQATFVYDATALGGIPTYATYPETGPVQVSIDQAAMGFLGGTLCFPVGPINIIGPQWLVGAVCANAGAANLIPPSIPAHFADVTFASALTLGATGVHMVECAEGGGPGACAGVATITEDANGTPENMAYTCTSIPSGTVSNVTSAPWCLVINPLPPPAPQTIFNTVIVNVVQPPPVLSTTKVAYCNGTIALPQSGGLCTPGNPQVASTGPVQFVITVNNAASPPTTATGVHVKDQIPPQFLGLSATPSQGSCLAIVGNLVDCTLGTILAGGSATITVTAASTDPNANGPVQNCVQSVTDTNVPTSTNPTLGCATVTFVPPAVSWNKTNDHTNVWITTCNPNAAPPANAQCVGQQVNTFSFDEVMNNQGDIAGLGGFSFDLHYDPTQFINPINDIDLSPAIAIFAAAGRVLDCSVTIPANGIIHVACASTGPFGSGPMWTGPKVMAHVKMTPQSFVVESIRPNKENGDVSTVKDDQVTVTNTCGQPLNDHSGNAAECQGKNLLGVGPGGVLFGNPNGGETTATIRRLEGDVNGDCSVTVADMQLEASKFGQSIGGLLYNLFFDVNEPLQHGDGEIDINDVQFVYGRFGSECSGPQIPPQPAQ